MYSSPFSNEENWGSKYVQDPAVTKEKLQGFVKKYHWELCTQIDITEVHRSPRLN